MSLNKVIARISKSILYFGAIILFFFFVFGIGIGVGYFNSLISHTDTMSKKELSEKINDVSEISQINYSNEQKVAMVSSDLIRTKVSSENISDNLKNAVISTEDEYFMTHKGYVPKAVLRAVLGETVGVGSSSGGSTLTQQLVKQQIIGDLPTFKRKAEEIVIALQIEKYFTKEEILTTYLNVSPFGRNNKGENIAGVEEAAQGIFGVSAKDLSIVQAAFIAGLPQSPIVYTPFDPNGALKSDEDLSWGLKRKDAVLFNMYREHKISKEEYEEAKAVDLKAQFLPQMTQSSAGKGYLYYTALDEATQIILKDLAKADNVTDAQLEDETLYLQYYDLASQKIRHGGYTITTTVDQGIYEAMQNAVAEYGYLVGDGVEVGNVLLDNKTGGVLGFVGGRDFQSSQVNHAFDTERSPGSSIKPLLVYGPAVDKGLIGTGTRFSNYPTNFQSSGQPIYHDGSKGTNEMMDFATALNYSWNIPAYWTYQTMLNKGMDASEYMKKMNFDIPNYAIESIAMGGGADVSVAQQANGYQTLANQGIYQQKYIIEKITDRSGNVIYQHELKPVQVYTKAAASIMNKLMEGVLNSNITTHFKANMQSINPALGEVSWSGKTGTSNDFVDGWLIVSSRGATLAGWSGIDDNTPMSRNSGENNSLYMTYLANAIYQANPEVFKINEKFEYDSSVTKSEVLVSTGERINNNGVDLSKIGKGTVKFSGATTVSYYATSSGAPLTTFRFGIGGSDSDYLAEWGKLVGGISSTDVKDKDKDKDKDKEKDTSTVANEDEDEDVEYEYIYE